jgi:Zn ribbon nucleic-acid-binding protein
MDRVVMLTSATDEWIECIECGYTEKRPTEVIDQKVPPHADDVGVVQFKPPR